MRYLKHVACGVPVGPLVAQMENHPELWDQHKLRTVEYSSPHSRLSDIWVRFNALENFDPQNPAAFVGPHESVFYPAWEALTELRPIVFDTLRFLEAERLGGILITRIPAGARCEPHVDRGHHAEYYSKAAISLKASTGQKFCFEDGEFESSVGDMWLFENQYLHWVNNPTDHERWTLIICYRRTH